MGMDFEARCVESARKEHVCFACRVKIPVGGTYIVYPCAGSDGRFRNIKFCPICGYLLTQKDGANAQTIREGEFSETLIPNCLRKKRNAFLRDHETAIREAGLDNPASAASAPRRIARIVVSREVFRRRVFFLRRKKMTPEQFPKGEEIVIQAGVAGETRTATVLGAWIINGKGIGRRGKFIAILTRGQGK